MALPLSDLDWIVIALMLVLSAGAVIVRRRGRVTSTERLVAGRSLTLPVLVATLVATWYGDVFGVTQIAFEQGIYMFVTQGVCWYAAYLCFAAFWARSLRRSAAESLPALVRQQFGPRAALLVAALMLLIALPLSCALGGGVLLALLSGLPLVASIGVVVLLGAVFGHVGGLRAVVRSDVVQCFFMCFAVALIAGVAIHKFGFSQLHALPQGHLSCAGRSREIFVWLLLATSMTWLNPALCQRCFAAKNERVARHGLWIACVIWAGFDVCTLLGALYARAVLPHADALDAYFQFGLQLLPSGLRGFFVAGLLAAILSTLDSFLLVSSSLLTDEFRCPRWLAFVLVVGSTIGLPLCFHHSVESMWLFVHGLFVSSLFLPVVFGKRAGLSERQFLGCCVVGGVVTITAQAPLAGFFANMISMGLMTWRRRSSLSSQMVNR